MKVRRRKGPVYWDRQRAFSAKNVRNATLAAMVLAILAVAGGVGYTKYADANSVPPSLAAAPSTATAADLAQPIKPPKVPKNARESAAVEASTSLVKIGEDASISVKTLPNSTCKIEVLYDKVPAQDPGLKPKVADDFGTITWDWTIGPATPTGMWPANITCAYNGRTAFVQANIDVTQ